MVVALLLLLLRLPGSLLLPLQSPLLSTLPLLPLLEQFLLLLLLSLPLPLLLPPLLLLLLPGFSTGSSPHGRHPVVHAVVVSHLRGQPRVGHAVQELALRFRQRA